MLTRAASGAQRSIQKLSGSPLGFGDCSLMVGIAGEVCVRKRNTAEAGLAQNVARRRLAIPAEEKAGLRATVGMAPAVEDDAGYVAPSIEARGSEHIRQLFA